MNKGIKENILSDIESLLQLFYLELKRLEDLHDCDEIMWQQLDEFQCEKVDDIFYWLDRIRSMRLYKSK